MNPATWVAVGIATWVVASIAFAAGLLRAAGRRRPTPADVQAVQDAPDFDAHAAQACQLTALPQLPADQWQRIEAQMHAAYDTYRDGGGLPGEHRTTWTREDYRS